MMRLSVGRIVHVCSEDFYGPGAVVFGPCLAAVCVAVAPDGAILTVLPHQDGGRGQLLDGCEKGPAPLGGQSKCGVRWHWPERES